MKNVFIIIFHLEGGERIELRVNNSEYVKLQKGQQGKLSFQGSKYLGFEE